MFTTRTTRRLLKTRRPRCAKSDTVFCCCPACEPGLLARPRGGGRFVAAILAIAAASSVSCSSCSSKMEAERSWAELETSEREWYARELISRVEADMRPGIEEKYAAQVKAAAAEFFAPGPGAGRVRDEIDIASGAAADAMSEAASLARMAEDLRGANQSAATKLLEQAIDRVRVGVMLSMWEAELKRGASHD